MRPFLQKIIELDNLIREQRTGSPAALGEKIGMSERSVFEYLRLMKERGAPIGYSRAKGSYFYQRNGSFKIRFMEQISPISE